MLLQEESAHVTNADAVDTWTQLTASGTAPTGAVVVQGAISYWQCKGTTDGQCWDGNGSVYFDDMVLTEVP